jgi:hypothetical protein
VFGVAKDKQNPEVRLFFPIKANLAKDRTGLSYRITEDRNAPVLNWSPEPVDIDADEAVSHEQEERTPTKTKQAAEWLRSILANGALSYHEVMDMGAAAGFAKRTLIRAKEIANVASDKPDGHSEWFWRIPYQECQP